MKKSIAKALLITIVVTSLGACRENCSECKAGGETLSISKTFCLSDYNSEEEYEKALKNAKKSGAKCEKK